MKINELINAVEKDQIDEISLAGFKKGAQSVAKQSPKIGKSVGDAAVGVGQGLGNAASGITRGAVNTLGGVVGGVASGVGDLAKNTVRGLGNAAGQTKNAFMGGYHNARQRNAVGAAGGDSVNPFNQNSVFKPRGSFNNDYEDSHQTDQIIKAIQNIDQRLKKANL